MIRIVKKGQKKQTRGMKQTDYEWASQKLSALLTKLICRAAEMLFWLDEIEEE
jgi:hypothetical protein